MDALDSFMPRPPPPPPPGHGPRYDDHDIPCGILPGEHWELYKAAADLARLKLAAFDSVSNYIAAHMLVR